MVLLFFVPVLNLFFFAIFAVIPTKSVALWSSTRAAAGLRPRTSPSHGETPSHAETPAQRFASAARAVAIAVIVATSLTALCATVLRNYGFGLFVWDAVPAWIAGRRAPFAERPAEDGRVPWPRGFLAPVDDGDSAAVRVGRRDLFGDGVPDRAAARLVRHPRQGDLCAV
ncbi:MAG: hypothetical protein EXS13_00495 [Planctomycetes bacterium]|nr:hypothetical protein [Planctomycetota bacterium]